MTPTLNITQNLVNWCFSTFAHWWYCFFIQLTLTTRRIKYSLHPAITQQTLRFLFFIFYKIHIANLAHLYLRCKKLVFFSATAMIAHCITIFSCLNAHSNQISLCTEVSFNLKFAKCCALLIMHSVFTICNIRNVHLILNLISWMELFAFCYYWYLGKQTTHFCRCQMWKNAA